MFPSFRRFEIFPARASALGVAANRARLRPAAKTPKNSQGF